MKNLKEEIRREVLRRIDLNSEVTDQELLVNIDKLIVEEGRDRYIGVKEKRQLKREIFNSIRRLDILQDLVEDNSITEIMVNGTNNIFIEKDGVITCINKVLNLEVFDIKDVSTQ